MSTPWQFFIGRETHHFNYINQQIRENKDGKDYKDEDNEDDSEDNKDCEIMTIKNKSFPMCLRLYISKCETASMGNA
jgi:hypothetical protein